MRLLQWGNVVFFQRCKRAVSGGHLPPETALLHLYTRKIDRVPGQWPDHDVDDRF
jgi:hypothetical protein